MRFEFLCKNCGEQVTVHRKLDWRKVRCPECGAVHSKNEALGTGSDEDDSNPYVVEAEPDPQEPCPRCAKPVPASAIVCNHCGFNRQTRTTLERVYQKVNKEWEAGLPFPVRFGIFLALQALVLVMMFIDVLRNESLATWIPSLAMGTPLLAFVLGTFSRINLSRSKKGKIKLTRTWRFCFLPLKTEDLRWQDYGYVVTDLSHPPLGMWDWLTLMGLGIPLVFPALLWWYFVLRPDHYGVALSNDTDQPLLLYRGLSEDMAQDIAATIRGVTGLP